MRPYDADFRDRVVADYIDTGDSRATGQRHGISHKTVTAWARAAGHGRGKGNHGTPTHCTAAHCSEPIYDHGLCIECYDEHHTDHESPTIYRGAWQQDGYLRYPIPGDPATIRYGRKN